MNSIRSDRGAVGGIVLGALVLAAVVAAGWWMMQGRNRLVAEIESGETPGIDEWRSWFTPTPGEQ